MELRKGAEALVRDTVAVAQFIGERAVGGAWAALATLVTVETPENIVKGEE